MADYNEYAFEPEAPQATLLSAAAAMSDSNFQFQEASFDYGMINNNNYAAAPMPARQSREVTLASMKTAPAAKSDTYEKLVAHAANLGTDQFFAYLNEAPKAKAALMGSLKQGHKVAIFAPTNTAMAKFNRETDNALRKKSNVALRENFAAQHMSLNLHEQLAEANAAGLDNPHAETLNPDMHMSYAPHASGEMHAVSLVNSGLQQRGSANTQEAYSYKGSTLHAIDRPLVN
jgi:uncharacterized surface protein with fasciclin (FAS1) repeats